MTSPAPMPSVFDAILDSLGEALRDCAGPLLQELVEALTGPLDDVGQRVTNGSVFDLDLTPDPNVLGQLAGTRAPAALTRDAQIDWIRAHPAWRRGTLDQLRAAVREVIGGNDADGPRIDIYERDDGPWHITVRVYTGELPASVDPAAVTAAALDHKPVGVVMVAEASGASYGHMSAEHGATYTDWAAGFPTYADARPHVPEEGSTA